MDLKKLLILLMSLTAVVWAQSATSTLVGTITDPGGALVPSARVSITNEGTNVVSTATTNNQGAYVASNLPPGSYTVQVDVSGFRPVKLAGVRLMFNTTQRADVHLETGTLQQAITVEAALPVVNSETSSLTYSMDAHAMESVPLNQRTIDRFVKLIPGNSSDYTYSNPSLSGSMYWGGTVFTLDGIQYTDTGNGGSSYSYKTGLSTFPSLDAVQEFKAETLNAKAEFAGSAAVSMVSKSGTNAFHGSLFEFNRNRALTARSYYSAANSVKPAYNRNEYGATLGGPIAKNKTFFFGSFEGLKQRTSSSVALTLGTNAMRQGNFAGVAAITDPLNNATAFPGSQIPASRLDSRTQTVLSKFVTLPNTAGTGVAGTGVNYRADVGTQTDVNRYLARLDHNLTSKDTFSLSGAFSKGSPYVVASGKSPAAYGNYSDAGYTTQSLTFTYNRILSPTAVNEFRAAYMGHLNLRKGQNTDFDPSTLFPQITYPRAFGGLPSFTISNYASISDLGGGSGDREITREITDNVTVVRGNHTIKTGFDFALSRISTGSTVNTTLGAFSFNGRYSGNAYADFVLGYPVATTIGSEAHAYQMYWARMAAYVQDDWQVSRKLTLNIGLRYDIQSMPQERDGQLVNFDFAAGKAVIRSSNNQVSGATDAAMYSRYPFVTSESVGWGSSMLTGDHNNIAPRFGFAYRPFGGTRTVIRAAYGVYYTTLPLFTGLRNMAANLPFYTKTNYNADSTSVPSLTLANPFPAGGGTYTTNLSLNAVKRNIHNAYAQQYNLTIERELPSNVGLRVSYAGNKGTNAPIWNGDLNRPAVMVSGLQAHRPYQPYGSVTTLRTEGSSSFNQLQVAATKRFDKSLYFNFSYSLSKMLDNVPVSSGPQNPYANYQERGNSDYVHRHTAYLMSSYNLPFGQGRRFLRGPDLAGKIAGGWEVVTMLQWLSGAPLSITFSNSVDGWYATRANTVSGQSFYASKRTMQQYLNTNAFVTPDKFTFGNGPRNGVFGPGYVVPDLGIHRQIKLREGINLDLRGDSFNFINHPSPSNPNTNISSPSTFGKITSVAVSARVVQLGGRITF